MDIINRKSNTVDLRRGPSRQVRQRRRFEASRRAHQTPSALQASPPLKRGRGSSSVSRLHRQVGNGRTSRSHRQADYCKTTRRSGEGFTWVLKNHSQKYNVIGGILLFVLVLGLFIFTGLTTVDIFFWAFFLSVFYWHVDSRVSIGGALVGLVIIMLISAGQGFKWWQADDLMEQIAVGVYFFLVIGVVKQIWEYRTESKNVRTGR